jgi:hypothetical protein
VVALCVMGAVQDVLAGPPAMEVPVVQGWFADQFGEVGMAGVQHPVEARPHPLRRHRAVPPQRVGLATAKRW